MEMEGGKLGNGCHGWGIYRQLYTQETVYHSRRGHMQYKPFQNRKMTRHENRATSLARVAFFLAHIRKIGSGEQRRQTNESFTKHRAIGTQLLVIEYFFPIVNPDAILDIIIVSQLLVSQFIINTIPANKFCFYLALRVPEMPYTSVSKREH
jgi:hypothetical protein